MGLGRAKAASIEQIGVVVAAKWKVEDDHRPLGQFGQRHGRLLREASSALRPHRAVRKKEA